MKEIQIANQLGLVALVDDEDFEWLNQYRWLTYATRSGYEYALTTIKSKRVYMHRLIAGVDGLVVDHINGHTLDNRRENLRAVTAAENSRNQHSCRPSNTGVKGVYARRDGRYMAKSCAGGSGRTYLGLYPTLKQAAAVVKAYEAMCAEQGEPTIQQLLTRVAELEAELESIKRAA